MNYKSTPPLRKALAFLVLLLLFFANGCKRDLLQPHAKDIGNALSFTEAKQYFEKNLSQSGLPKKLMATDGTGSPAKAKTIQDILYSKQPVWDKAYQKLISTGTAVKIPLDFGDVRKVVNESTKAYVPYSSLNYLLMYKDSLQRIHAEWVTLKPTLKWLEGNRTSFEGSIVVRDWNGNTLKTYSYGTGQPGHLDKLSAVKGTVMGGGNAIPLRDGCLIWAVKEKCTCHWAWSSGTHHVGQWNPDKCDYCDLCVDYFCMPEPECTVCPPRPDWGGGSGGGGGNNGSGYTPGGNGDSGGTGPSDYKPENCTNGEQVVNPDGSMSLPPCVPEPTCANCPPPLAGPDAVAPIDALETVYSEALGRMVTFGEITSFYESNAELAQQILSDDPMIPNTLIMKWGFEKATLIVEEMLVQMKMHPNWPHPLIMATATYYALKGEIHFALDLGGLFPVYGEAFDILNSAIYFVEGDYVNAAFSAGSAVPVYGWVSTGGKWVRTIGKTVTRPITDAVGKVAYRAVKNSNGTVRFIRVAVSSFNHVAIKALKAVKPADNTLVNLSKSLVDQMSLRIAPTSPALKKKINDIVANGDAGKLTESISDDIFATNGFVKHEAHFGSDNGFDGVYIKKDAAGNVEEIIINEAKQVQSTGNIKLNRKTLNKGPQMSNEWINQTINEMRNIPNRSDLGDLLFNNRDRIIKIVTGVDRSTSEIVVLKLDNY